MTTTTNKANAAAGIKIKPPIFDHDNADQNDEAKDGRRQNQLLRQIRQCPLFEPTLKEFSEISFQDYLIECEKLIDPSCGVYKVSFQSFSSNVVCH